MVSSISITSFILSAAYLLSDISPSLQYEQISPTPDLTNPVQSEQECAANNVILREEQNDNWMVKLEGEWKDFTASLENEKIRWIQEKEKEWDEWLEIMQEKWTHYDRNLNPTYKNYILKKSSEWDNFDWEYWANTEWHELMEKDWKNWIYGNKLSLNKIIDNKWINWSNEKMAEWLIQELNDEEGSDTQTTNIGKSSSSEENDEYFSSLNDKIFSKNEEWEHWTDRKEKLIKKIKNSNWSEWKNNKYASFNQWRESFIKKWLRERQWEIMVNNQIN
ncbi:tryptophan-rich antigen (Pv-fam-a) [Plasmodium vivax North Korean]|uniref:Tryptophan-rich protein n=2 Tax=Plasmodium vivax TaxID=5855 RepID=A0A564ZQF6_PLAVI|nr:tryptophan-rich antigen (Pv-fam-a) [Plasmodium vivax North Korean]VUZ93696.1 tryptophan-rich antigen [Plasmodium vivax]